LSFGIVSAPAFAKATARQAVTGLFKPASAPNPRQNSKILALHGCCFSSNALVVSFLKIRISREKIFNIRHSAGK
jgi:hypothetical protein